MTLHKDARSVLIGIGAYIRRRPVPELQVNSFFHVHLGFLGVFRPPLSCLWLYDISVSPRPGCFSRWSSPEIKVSKGGGGRQHSKRAVRGVLMEGENLSALCIGNVWKQLRPNAKLLTRARRRNHGGEKKKGTEKKKKKKDIDTAASCGHTEVLQPEQANAAANSSKLQQKKNMLA